MIRRSTWILLGVFLLLLGGAVFWQKSPLKKTLVTPTLAPTSLPALLNNINDISITQIDILSNQNQTLTLIRNQSKQWKFSPDQSAQPDQGRVEELITTLKSLKPLSAIDPAATLSDLGLETPSYKINLQLQETGSALLAIGQPTVTGSGYYARLNNQEIVVLNKVSTDELLKLLTIENLIGTGKPTLKP